MRRRSYYNALVRSLLQGTGGGGGGGGGDATEGIYFGGAQHGTINSLIPTTKTAFNLQVEFMLTGSTAAYRGLVSAGGTKLSAATTLTALSGAFSSRNALNWAGGGFSPQTYASSKTLEVWYTFELDYSPDDARFYVDSEGVLWGRENAYRADAVQHIGSLFTSGTYSSPMIGRMRNLTITVGATTDLFKMDEGSGNTVSNEAGTKSFTLVDRDDAGHNFWQDTPT